MTVNPLIYIGGVKGTIFLILFTTDVAPELNSHPTGNAIRIFPFGGIKLIKVIENVHVVTSSK